MNQKHSLLSKSPKTTEEIGAKVGRMLKGGEVIELISDVGGGKTTLVRGIAAGAGSHDVVASPTFTISKVYQAAALTIAHFDFYRLQDAGLIANELEEYLEANDCVVIVEWPKLIEGLMPEDKLQINIESIDETVRKLHFSYAERVDYLLKELK